MEIETQRLRLREFSSEDWRAVIAYQSDPLYLRYYDWTQRTENDVRAFVDMFVGWQADVPRLCFQWAVILAATGKLIGNGGVRVNDPEQREANFGFEFDSRFWGQGYATEVGRVLLKFAFEELKIHRLWATTLTVNIGSIRVLEKLGLRQEAWEREKYWIKEGWRDSLTFAILDHEWLADTNRNDGDRSQ